MNTQKTFKSFLKTLPLLGILTTGLTFAPTVIYADDNEHNERKYSHKRDEAHHNRNTQRHNQHANNNRSYSYDKRHNKYNHKPKHHRNNWRGYHTEHEHNRQTHHGYQSHHQPVYIVNDHHYSDHYIGLDRLGFMIGLRTGNFDITFHD